MRRAWFASPHPKFGRSHRRNKSPAGGQSGRPPSGRAPRCGPDRGCRATEACRWSGPTAASRRRPDRCREGFCRPGTSLTVRPRPAAISFLCRSLGPRCESLWDWTRSERDRPGGTRPCRCPSKPATDRRRPASRCPRPGAPGPGRPRRPTSGRTCRPECNRDRIDTWKLCASRLRPRSRVPRRATRLGRERICAFRRPRISRR